MSSQTSPEDLIQHEPPHHCAPNEAHEHRRAAYVLGLLRQGVVVEGDAVDRASTAELSSSATRTNSTEWMRSAIWTNDAGSATAMAISYAMVPTPSQCDRRPARGFACHYAAADVFVFPSRTDTFELVRLEAVACGVPAAALPATGPIDEVEHGRTGILDDNLASAVRRALALDPAECVASARVRSREPATRVFESLLSRWCGSSTGPAKCVGTCAGDSR